MADTGDPEDMPVTKDDSDPQIEDTESKMVDSNSQSDNTDEREVSGPDDDSEPQTDDSDASADDTDSQTDDTDSQPDDEPTTADLETDDPDAQTDGDLPAADPQTDDTNFQTDGGLPAADPVTTSPNFQTDGAIPAPASSTDTPSFQTDGGLPPAISFDGSTLTTAKPLAATQLVDTSTTRPQVVTTTTTAFDPLITTTTLIRRSTIVNTQTALILTFDSLETTAATLAKSTASSTPTPSPHGLALSTLLPAIIVPLVVFLVLIPVLIMCVLKRHYKSNGRSPKVWKRNRAMEAMLPASWQTKPPNLPVSVSQKDLKYDIASPEFESKEKPHELHSPEVKGELPVEHRAWELEVLRPVPAVQELDGNDTHKKLYKVDIQMIHEQEILQQPASKHRPKVSKSLFTPVAIWPASTQSSRPATVCELQESRRQDSNDAVHLP